MMVEDIRSSNCCFLLLACKKKHDKMQHKYLHCTLFRLFLFGALVFMFAGKVASIFCCWYHFFQSFMVCVCVLQLASVFLIFSQCIFSAFSHYFELLASSYICITQLNEREKEKKRSIPNVVCSITTLW